MKTKITYFALFIAGIFYAQDTDITYNYDDLNQLIQVVNANGETRSYIYDNLGNRVQLNIESLGIEDVEVLKNAITLYPNPTEEYLNIAFPSDFSMGNFTIEIYNASGTLLENTTFQVVEYNIQISVKALNNGVYLLRLQNEELEWSQLFIKK